MRKQAISQAAGLMGTPPQSGTRLMAVVCHGDEQAELPVLWTLCAALTNLNYQVTVLDGTKQESQDNPGLQQILDYSVWQEATADALAPWNILPARQGLHTLAATSASAHWITALQSSSLHAPNAVVIVYAPADLLASFSLQTGVTPLLALSSGKTSLMTSYLALKRLLINTHRVPTIAHVHSRMQAAEAPEVVARCLQDCARQFLHVEITMHPLRLDTSAALVHADMQALVQLLLDESVTLDTPPWNGMRPPAYASHGFATRI